MERTINQELIMNKSKKLLNEARFINDQNKLRSIVKIFTFLFTLVTTFVLIISLQLFITDLELLKNITSTFSSKLLLFPVELLPIILIGLVILLNYGKNWQRSIVKPFLLAIIFAIGLGVFSYDYVTTINNNPVRQLAFATIQKIEPNVDFGTLAKLQKIGDNKYLATVQLNNLTKIYTMDSPKIIPAIGTNIWLRYSDSTITDMGIISEKRVF